MTKLCGIVLAAGLRVLEDAGSTAHDVIIVTPVDMLPAEVGTHRTLLAHLTGTALAVTPLYGGRGAHPVIAHRASRVVRAVSRAASGCATGTPGGAGDGVCGQAARRGR